MSPRSASVNEAMRRRSRERLLQATVELVEQRGYEATTLADITQRAGSARGLVSYYFSGKRALLQSAVLMLHHLDEPETAERVQTAIENVYREGKTLTRDVGGKAGTAEFADAVLAAMEAPVAK